MKDSNEEVYLKLWGGTLENLDDMGFTLSGELVTALLRYRVTGVMPEVSQPIRYLFREMARAIDRDVSRCNTLKENGNKGGRKPKVTKEKPKVTEEKPKVTEEKPNSTDRIENIEYRKENVELELDNAGYGNESEMIADSETMNEIFDLADDMGISGNRTYDQLNTLCADYSASWVLEAMNRTWDAGKDKYRLSYIKKILANWKENGGIDSEKPQKEDGTPKPHFFE